MEERLIYLGVVGLLVQAVTFVFLIKNTTKQQFITTLAAQIAGVVANIGFFMYYNSLAGHGEAPGLTYFRESLLEAAFAGVGILMLISSIIIGIVRKGK